MFSAPALHVMHALVGYLLQPVVWALLAATAVAALELGTLLAERVHALPRWRERGDGASFERLAVRRIERTDLLARLAPMLGLMGTLIPLGPGLAALGAGELDVLTTAMSVAFDTTVLGLLVGMVGFVAGRLRRRWYDETLDAIERRKASAGAGGEVGVIGGRTERAKGVEAGRAGIRP